MMDLTTYNFQIDTRIVALEAKIERRLIALEVKADAIISSEFERRIAALEFRAIEIDQRIDGVLAAFKRANQELENG